MSIPITTMSSGLESSPFSKHFGTNYIPTDSEIKNIGEFLTEPLKELSRVNEHIVRTQETLDRLVQEREKLRNVIASHSALMSPIRRLPVEVIQKIFFHCLAHRRNPAMSVEEAPLLIGRICSQWRNISLATGQLWARIHIPFPTSPHPHSYLSNFDRRNLKEVISQKLYSRVSGVSEWLSRSGDFPLSISLALEAGNDHHTDMGGPTKLLLDILQIHLSRWREVKFEGSAPKMFTDFMSALPPSNLPLLESFSMSNLNLRYWGLGSESKWDKSGLFLARTLRNLSFYNVSPKRLIYMSPSAGMRLTNLYVRNCTLSLYAMLDLLRKCPNLVVCDIQINGYDDDQTITSRNHIELHSLQSFTIIECMPTTAYAYLLELPSLRHLTYRGPKEFEPEDEGLPCMANILPLLLQTGNYLETLTIDPNPFCINELIQCLRLATHISVLRFYDSDPWMQDESSYILNPMGLIGDELLHLLSVQHEGDLSLPVPLLEEFKNNSNSIFFSEHAVLEFIKSRREAANASTGKALKLVDINSIIRCSEEVDLSWDVVGEKELKVSLKAAPDIMTGFISPWRGVSEELPATAKLYPATSFTLER